MANVCIAVALLSLTCSSAWSQDWPQLQGNPQRTGYTPEAVKLPLKLSWKHDFPPERISCFTQAVTHRDTVFIGTMSGNLYALDTGDGKTRWTFACGSPIPHTAAYADGRVVVGALDGLYAVEVDHGTQAWKYLGDPLYGFSAAPLIADGTVFIGQRGGFFYALDLRDGSVRWTFKAGAPILNSAAFDAGKVFFCDEALYLHCLDAKTGAEVWKSDQLYGQSAKGYCPVVVNGLVIIRPMASPVTQVPYWSDAEAARLTASKVEELQKDTLPQNLMAAQDRLVKYYQERPWCQDLFILDERSGRQAYIAPHFTSILALAGGTGAPAWDGKHSIMLPWSFGGFPAFWGRFDLERQRFVEVMPPNKIGGNPDETVNVTVAGDLVFIMHCQEGNCQFTGIYDLASKTIHDLPGREGRSWELSDTCESGNNAAAIADGRVYHIVFNSLWSWTSAAGAGQ